VPPPERFVYKMYIDIAKCFIFWVQFDEVMKVSRYFDVTFCPDHPERIRHSGCRDGAVSCMKRMGMCSSERLLMFAVLHGVSAEKLEFYKNTTFRTSVPTSLKV
jgi:hypothetical protein